MYGTLGSWRWVTDSGPVLVDHIEYAAQEYEQQRFDTTYRVIATTGEVLAEVRREGVPYTNEFYAAHATLAAAMAAADGFETKDNEALRVKTPAGRRVAAADELQRLETELFVASQGGEPDHHAIYATMTAIERRSTFGVGVELSTIDRGIIDVLSLFVPRAYAANKGQALAYACGEAIKQVADPDRLVILRSDFTLWKSRRIASLISSQAGDAAFKLEKVNYIQPSIYELADDALRRRDTVCAAV